MSFGESISTVFRKYADFNGRASRSEIWWFLLFSALVSAALNAIDTAANLRVGASEQEYVINDVVVPVVNTGAGLLSTLWSLAVLLPTLAVGARRLHDTGRSAWWLLWCLLLSCLCGAGIVLIIVFWCLSPEPGENRFGPPVTQPAI